MSGEIYHADLSPFITKTAWSFLRLVIKMNSGVFLFFLRIVSGARVSVPADEQRTVMTRCTSVMGLLSLVWEWDRMGGDPSSAST